LASNVPGREDVILLKFQACVGRFRPEFAELSSAALNGDSIIGAFVGASTPRPKDQVVEKEKWGVDGATPFKLTLLMLVFHLHFAGVATATAASIF